MTSEDTSENDYTLRDQMRVDQIANSSLPFDFQTRIQQMEEFSILMRTDLESNRFHYGQ